MAIKIIAEAKGKTSASITIRRPKWSDVYKNYPKINGGTNNENDLPALFVFKSIFGDNYDKDIFSNACATRISIALLKSGISVRHDYTIKVGDLKGKGIITSAAKLNKWLTTQFGKADIIISPKSFNELSIGIGNKKGIYSLLSNNYKWASGHATLWYNGNAIGKHDYYEHAKEIHFWELK